MPENTRVTLRLKDLQGKLYFEETFVTHQDEPFLFETGSFSKGMYVLDIVLPDKTLERKIILK